MKLLIFSAYDTKTQAYMTPFYSHTPGSAIRSFTDAAEDPASIVAQHPDDFLLFQLGEWDDHTGTISSHEPRSLGSAAQYLQNGKTSIEEAAQ